MRPSLCISLRLLLLFPALTSGAEPPAPSADEDVVVVQPPVAERFISGKAEGYFFYNDPKEMRKKKPKAEIKPEPQKVEPEKKAEEKLAPWSVAWLRKWMPILAERAVDKPTKENLEAYAYAKRVMFDKSQVHATALHSLVVSDPLLDENNRMPMAEFAKSMFMLDEINARNEAVKSIAGKAGFFVFYDSKCSWCAKQVPVLNSFSSETGMAIKYISIDGKPIEGAPSWVLDNGHAAMLDLKIFPTTVLAVPPKGYYILSQGMMDKQTLAERVVMAGEKAGLLTEPMLARLFPARRGVLTTDDLQDESFSDDPSVWVAKLKEKLRGRY